MPSRACPGCDVTDHMFKTLNEKLLSGKRHALIILAEQVSARVVKVPRVLESRGMDRH